MTENKGIEKINKMIESLEKLREELVAEYEEFKKNSDTHKQMEEGKEYDYSFDCLAVTNVQVFPFKEGPSLGYMKGHATIVLNDQMIIRGLRVMDGENGLFVGYPNDPFYKGEDFRSICNPITRQLRDHIENCVIEKYNKEIANG